jgi:hypothetical protein
MLGLGLLLRGFWKSDWAVFGLVSLYEILHKSYYLLGCICALVGAGNSKLFSQRGRYAEVGVDLGFVWFWARHKEGKHGEGANVVCVTQI